MSSSLKIHFTENYNKTEKLAFLKKRYKKLILDPRKEKEAEIALIHYLSTAFVSE